MVALKSKLWFAESIGQPVCLGSHFQTPVKCLLKVKPADSPSWRFRGDLDSLKNIWLNSASAVIFFDGASKGNPRASDAGGLILSTDRLISIKFSWGLGFMSNN